jgi:hypothetical protein
VRGRENNDRPAIAAISAQIRAVCGDGEDRRRRPATRGGEMGPEPRVPGRSRRADL